MNKIELHNVLPDVFKDVENLSSDIWQQTVIFQKGDFYLVEANSGTGKSSLCSYVYGYRNDYSGKILFDDKDVKQLNFHQWDDIRSKELSFLFQELRLFPELTALENIVLKNNLTQFKTEKEIDNLFGLLDIDNKKNVVAAKLSWGQQQRVAIIRSLCQPFDFLLLDEPISHLDETNALIIADLLQKEANQRGASIIATSIGKQLPLTYNKTYSL